MPTWGSEGAQSPGLDLMGGGMVGTDCYEHSGRREGKVGALLFWAGPEPKVQASGLESENQQL